MEVNDPSLFLHPSTPPPTASPTPAISAKDPIGDALEIVFRAAVAGPSSLNPSPMIYNAHPGDGWYETVSGSAHVGITIPSFHPADAQRNSDNIPAKYLKAALLAGTPTLLGCHGITHPVYSTQLVASPFHAPAPRYHNPLPLEILENPFDMRIERVLLFLGDLGVMGDIYMLCSLPLRCQGLYR
jgi:hypothetical protein